MEDLEKWLKIEVIEVTNDDCPPDKIKYSIEYAEPLKITEAVSHITLGQYLQLFLSLEEKEIPALQGNKIRFKIWLYKPNMPDYEKFKNEVFEQLFFEVSLNPIEKASQHSEQEISLMTQKASEQKEYLN